MKIIYILSFFLFKVVFPISIKNSFDSDRMYIFFEEKIFEINLIESDITNELISILPLKTKLIEENTNILNHRYSIPLWEDIEVSNFVLEQESINILKSPKAI